MRQFIYNTIYYYLVDYYSLKLIFFYLMTCIIIIIDKLKLVYILRNIPWNIRYCHNLCLPTSNVTYYIIDNITIPVIYYQLNDVLILSVMLYN